jgi:phosphoribosylformylglycinamidine cyclo-ligase
MYQVYNMGHRMEVYTTAEHAQRVLDIAAVHGVEARIVGRVEAREADGPRLTIKGPESTETYS